MLLCMAENPYLTQGKQMDHHVKSDFSIVCLHQKVEKEDSGWELMERLMRLEQTAHMLVFYT